MRRVLLIAALGAALLLPAIVLAGGPTADGISGVWLTGDQDGHVKIERCDDAFCGTLVWVKPKPDVKVPLDDKNPDPALRSRKLEGVEILQGLTYKGKDRWGGGTIYDPKTGNTYHVRITMVDGDTLKLRGYIGIPLLGRTEEWHRVKDAPAS